VLTNDILMKINACECRRALQTIYDSYFISFYNLLFTSMPCMMMAIFEQVSE